MSIVLRRERGKDRERRLFRVVHECSPGPQPIRVQRTFSLVAAPPGHGLAPIRSLLTQVGHLGSARANRAALVVPPSCLAVPTGQSTPPRSATQACASPPAPRTRRMAPEDIGLPARVNSSVRQHFLRVSLTFVFSVCVCCASAQKLSPFADRSGLLAGSRGSEPVVQLWEAHDEPSAPGFGSAREQTWERGIGEGFSSSARSITLGAGATYGLAAFGSREAHDLALVSLTYGHMLGNTRGDGHWYRGSPEFRLELFTGAQFSPSSDWFVGLTPHLRYNFATGTRWIPFVDAGAGITATGIGPPDMSGTFEFNLQAGLGVQWFIKKNLALGLEARYVHWSCAGISHPNLGLNGLTGLLAVTRFF